MHPASFAGRGTGYRISRTRGYLNDSYDASVDRAARAYTAGVRPEVGGGSVSASMVIREDECLAKVASFQTVQG